MGTFETGLEKLTREEQLRILGEFLRDARARVGKSQEQVAEEIGWASPKMVGKLEQARYINPTQQFLEAFAQVLDLSAPQRHHALQLGLGKEPEHTIDYEKVWSDDPALRDMVDRSDPDPAFVMDPTFEVWHHNEAFARWFCDFSARQEGERNFAMWMFADPHAPHVLVDWRRIAAPVLLGRVRVAHAKYPTDARLAAVIDRLRQASSFARKLWDQDASAVADWPSTRRLRTPGHTDPKQRADRKHHVTVHLKVWDEPDGGGKRIFVAALLADEHRKLPEVTSELACAACQRAQAATRVSA